MRIAGGRRARFDGPRVWRGLLVTIKQPCCVLGQRGAANSPHTVPPVLLARSSEVPPVSSRDRFGKSARGSVWLLDLSVRLTSLPPAKTNGSESAAGLQQCCSASRPQQSSTGDTDG
jgi:hypothetical protein